MHTFPGSSSEFGKFRDRGAHTLIQNLSLLSNKLHVFSLWGSKVKIQKLQHSEWNQTYQVLKTNMAVSL